MRLYVIMLAAAGCTTQGTLTVEDGDGSTNVTHLGDGGGDADTDADADSDSDADTDADTDPHTPAPPSVDELIATQVPFGVEVSYAVTDPDGDQDALSLDIDGLPEGIDVSTTSAGSVTEAVDECSMLGQTIDVQATATDLTDLTSPEVSTQLVLAGTAGGVVAENAFTSTEMGEVDLPFAVCGEIDETRPTESCWSQDCDMVAFTLPAGGYYTIQLQWDDPTTDLDLMLYEYSPSAGQTAIVGSSHVHTAGQAFETLIPPDRLTARAYSITVLGYSGPPTGWRLHVDQ